MKLSRGNLPFKRQSHKMAKHTQTICRQIADKLFQLFGHFVNLVLIGLKSTK